MSSDGRLPRAGKTLRQRALQYPEAYEEFPWGHCAIKVNGKSFLFLGTHAGSFSLSVKLPHSGAVALSLPFASPTEYGLGRSGWVTARFEGKAAVPVGLLLEWVDESYRAIAPKKVLARLDSEDPPPNAADSKRNRSGSSRAGKKAAAAKTPRIRRAR
jgi:predicted DNA-binding protein (MmcQ/YjbR family)